MMIPTLLKKVICNIYIDNLVRKEIDMYTKTTTRKGSILKNMRDNRKLVQGRNEVAGNLSSLNKNGGSYLAVVNEKISHTRNTSQNDSNENKNTFLNEESVHSLGHDLMNIPTKKSIHQKVDFKTVELNFHMPVQDSLSREIKIEETVPEIVK